MLKYLEYAWNTPGQVGDRLGHSHLPPRFATDITIRGLREQKFDRFIVHYHQPHSPYTTVALNDDRELCEHELKPFKYLKETGDRETVWELYIQDLRTVLDDVELLLNNANAERVVISSDHGESFGEYGVYGHPAGSFNPYVRTVPWATTVASDSGDYTPEWVADDSKERSVEDTLNALGYL